METGFKDALENGNFQSLKSGKTQLLKQKSKEYYPTPSGKIEFYSSVAEKSGLQPIPEQKFHNIVKDGFILLTSATAKYTSTQFQEIYGKIPAVIIINPEDAKLLNIKENDSVFLANSSGQVKLKANISNTVPCGVLWSPRQSEDLNGIPVNSIMDSLPQKIGSGPRFNSTIVKIN